MEPHLKQAILHSLVRSAAPQSCLDSQLSFELLTLIKLRIHSKYCSANCSCTSSVYWKYSNSALWPTVTNGFLYLLNSTGHEFAPSSTVTKQYLTS